MENTASNSPYSLGSRTQINNDKHTLVDCYRLYSDNDLLAEFNRLTTKPNISGELAILRRIHSLLALLQERGIEPQAHRYANVDQLIAQAEREDNVKVAFLIFGMAATAFIVYKLFRLFAL